MQTTSAVFSPSGGGLGRKGSTDRPERESLEAGEKQCYLGAEGG